MAILNTTWVKRKINNVLTKTFAIAHIKSTYYDYSKGKTLDDVLIETEDFDQTAVQESEISPVILSKINAVKTQSDNEYALLSANKAEKTEVYNSTEVDQLVDPLEESVQNLEETAYIKTATGKYLSLKTADGGIGLNKILGESTQDQEPSPSSPQPIVSAGEFENILKINLNGKNLLNPSLTGITIVNVKDVKNNDSIIFTATASDAYVGQVSNKGSKYKNEYGNLIDVRNISKLHMTIISKQNINTNFISKYDDSLTSKGYYQLNGMEQTIDVSDCSYVSLRFGVNPATVNTTYTFKVQVEEGDSATEYEPYNHKLIQIPISEPLRGIGDIKDEIINRNGVWGVLRRIYHKVFDGSENWFLDDNSPGTNSKRCYANMNIILKTVNSNDDVPQLVCSHVNVYSRNYTWSNDKDGCSLHTKQFFLRIIGCTTLDQYKTWISANNPEIIAPLATPVFEPFEDQNPFYELESYADNTYINTDDGIADLSVFYSSGNTGAIALKAYNESKKTKVITTSENTVTEEGKYAVDATQLNPNVSGSLAKKVSDNTTKLSGIEAGANNYVHPTTSGNKHIPSGGAAGKFLKWLSDGTAEWDFVSQITPYKFDYNGADKKYIKLGTATFGILGEHIVLEVFSGNGFNGSISQNRNYKIHLRAGNGVAVNGKYYVGLVEYHLMNISGHEVYVVQNSKTSITVYVGSTTFMGNGFYNVMCSNGASWTHQIEPISTLPDGAALLESKKIAYTDSFSNATQSAAGLMSASDKTKLDGVATGANKTTSTDIQNAMKADGVQVGTTYTFSGVDIKSSSGVHMNANNGNSNFYAHCNEFWALKDESDVLSGSNVYAGAYSNVSSKRFKENINSMTEDEAIKLLKLRPVSYDYIENGEKNCFGLIAEEVNEVIQYPVIFNDDGVVNGLDYSRFVPYLIKMIQIQQKEIDDLKKKIIS